MLPLLYFLIPRSRLTHATCRQPVARPARTARTDATCCRALLPSELKRRARIVEGSTAQTHVSFFFPFILALLYWGLSNPLDAAAGPLRHM